MGCTIASFQHRNGHNRDDRQHSGDGASHAWRRRPSAHDAAVAAGAPKPSGHRRGRLPAPRQQWAQPRDHAGAPSQGIHVRWRRRPPQPLPEQVKLQPLPAYGCRLLQLAYQGLFLVVWQQQTLFCNS